MTDNQFLSSRFVDKDGTEVTEVSFETHTPGLFVIEMTHKTADSPPIYWGAKRTGADECEIAQITNQEDVISMAFPSAEEAEAVIPVIATGTKYLLFNVVKVQEKIMESNKEAALRDFANALEKMTLAGVLRWHDADSADALEDGQAAEVDLLVLLSKPEGKGQIQIIDREDGSVLDVLVNDTFPGLSDIEPS